MEKSGSGMKVALLAGVAVGAVLLFSGKSKAAGSTTADPCKPLIDKANKVLPTATAADIPALKELASSAQTLGCLDLVATINKKIADLSKTTTPGTGTPKPKYQLVPVPSGMGPIEFSKKYGMSVADLVKLNSTKLVRGVIDQELGKIVQDCKLQPVLNPATGGDDASGGPNPEYFGSTVWTHTGQVDNATNRAMFRTQNTKPYQRVQDWLGAIDCANPGSPTGRTYYEGGAQRYVKPWFGGLELLVPTSAVGVAGDNAVSVEGCIACELPNPKAQRELDEAMERAEEIAEAGDPRFGALPFGGVSPRFYE